MVTAGSLDDALGDTLRKLLRNGRRIRPSKGDAREFTGVLIELTDPRSRFSRTEGRGVLFSSLGETLWYLAGSDRLDFIEYYIPKYREYISASHRAVRAPGGYGPRLFGGETSQMTRLLNTLKARNGGNSDTRQAVVQIFRQTDLRPGNGDVPCTTTLQFLPRNGKLDLAVTMRSNDAYIGFPSDVFAFTFIQELVARTLNLELGKYSHFVGSLHLYDKYAAKARDYLNEGFQTTFGMPPMPSGDPWKSVDWLLEMERSIRSSSPEPDATGLDAYWLDLCRLLKMKNAIVHGDMRKLVQLKNQMASPVYAQFIRGRQDSLARQLEPQPQPSLFV